MSKRRKRIVFYSSPFVVIGLILLWGDIYLNGVEANARALAETGQAAIKLLGEYKAGVESLDSARVVACYGDDSFQRQGTFAVLIGKEVERDGIVDAGVAVEDDWDAPGLCFQKWNLQRGKKEGGSRRPRSSRLTPAQTFALPILYMPVPHTGQTPLVAGLPFFMVTALASFISR